MKKEEGERERGGGGEKEKKKKIHRYGFRVLFGRLLFLQQACLKILWEPPFHLQHLYQA